METNILTSVKKLLGITEEYKIFDVDIVMYINSVFSILTQLGVGPASGFCLVTGDETWEEYFGTVSSDTVNLELIKAYVAMKVKAMFDPPTTSSSKEALDRIIAEYEWRINVMVDPMNEFVPVGFPI